MRSLAQPRHRWKDTIKKDLKEQAQDTVQLLVNMVMKISLL
jgi:hypothetical protein